MDLVLTVPALVMLSPVLLVTAAAIALESGRPILFIHTRIGRGGREFGMVKFRSMAIDAAATGPYFTRAGDSRITRVGRFIRCTSIDELPQLFNVLKGDMSLIGPRPDVPVQRALYSDSEWAERCSMRPGITGLAQALLRSTGSDAERLAHDLFYVREHGFVLDLKILWLTLGRLTGKGAN